MGEAEKDSTSACQVAASFIITATVSLKDAETRKTLETVSHYHCQTHYRRQISPKKFTATIFFNIHMDTTHETTIKWLHNNNNNNTG